MTPSMRLAPYSDEERQQTVTPLFEHKTSNGSLTKAIHDLTDKIAQSDSNSLESFEGDIEHLIYALEQQMQGINGAHDKPQGYKALEKSLQDIVEHIEYSDQNNAQALRTLQVKLAQISARVADAPAEAMQNNASIIHDLEQRIGDLTTQVEHAQSGSNNEGVINSLEERINQFADKLETMPDPKATDGADYDARLEQIQSTIANMANQQPEVTRNTITALEQRIADIAKQLEGTVLKPEPSPQILDLENRVRALDAAVAQAQNSGQNQVPIKDFEAQVFELSQRLSTLEQRFQNLQSVENSVAQLFDAAEQNRAWREQTTQQMSEQQNITAQISALNSLEEKFNAVQARAQSDDQHTKQTLDVVYKSLEKLTERLNILERTEPLKPAEQTPPPLPKDPPQSIAPPAKQEAQNQVEDLARMLSRSIEKNTPVPAVTQSTSAEAVKPAQAANQPVQTSAPQSSPAAANTAAPEDFIAAARRAALTAASAGESAAQSPFELSSHLSKEIKKDTNKNGVSRGKIGKRKAFLLVASALLAISAASAYTYMGAKKAKPVASAPATAPATRTLKSSAQQPARDNSSNNIQNGTVPTTERVNTSKAPSYSPIQTGSVKPTQPPESPAPPPSPNDMPKSDASVGSNDPRMDRSESLMEPTPNWSVSRIVQSMRERQVQNAQALQTGSLPNKANERISPGAAQGTLPQSQRLSALSKATEPLPPENIGPKSLRTAAASGNMAAQFEIAVRYSKGKLTPQDYSKAATWYQKAAAQGLAPAQYRLGTFYEKGRGVPLDKAAARIWYERAAEKGNVKAMHNLAVIYSNSNDAKPNYAKAALWFRKAAELGLTDSQYNLGILNERGLGTPKDVIEAYKWFSIASRSGDGEAKKRIAKLEKNLTSQMLVKAKLAAQTWEASPTVAIANEVTPPEGGWEAMSEASQPTVLTHRQMVLETQSRLNKLGFHAGPPDGIMGQQTHDAIRNFQTGNDMKATGEVSPVLIERLRKVSG